MARFPFPPLLLALVAAVPRVAVAADPPPPARADEPVPGEPYDEIVIVGRRLRGQAAADPTGAATVVSADRFAGEAKGVAELVATAPGVAVNEYGGLGHLTTVSIRGSTADGVLVLVDGIPLNTAFGGGVDLESIPRPWIDRIEVVRGVEGAVYGAGALGGAVNVITRRSASGWSAEAGAGSFGTFTAAADGAFNVGGTSLFVGANADWTAGDFPYRYDPTPSDADPTKVEATRTNNGAARAGSIVKVRTPLGAATLDALAQVTAAHRELPGWPYALTPGDRQDDGRALVAVRLAGPLETPLQLAGRLTGRVDWLDARFGLDDASERGGAAGADLEARWTHGPGLLRVALEAKDEAATGEGLGETQVRTSVAAAASEDVRVLADRLRVAPAIRIERAGPFGGVSAKLGASLAIAGPFTLRASGGRSFRPPSFSELYLQQGLVEANPDLVPEQGIGGDAALVIDSGPLFASVGGHVTLYRDLIAYQLSGFGRFKPFNADKVLVRGLELEAATTPLRSAFGFSLSGSYTLLSTEILRGPEGTLGNWVPLRARDRLYARASIAPGRFGAHVEAHYVGRQYRDAANLGRIDPAMVWNAGGSLLLSATHALRIHVEIRNLLDDRALQDGFGNPLPGRMVLFILRAGSTEKERT